MNNYQQYAKSRGNTGESAVCDFLVRHGYRILRRNFTIRGGEIDIIAEKNGITAFVEVKTRKEGSLTTGEEAVTGSKKMHIVKTAQCYLNSLGKSVPCRFDVAVVTLEGERVTHLKYYVNAFDASR